MDELHPIVMNSIYDEPKTMDDIPKKKVGFKSMTIVSCSIKVTVSIFF